jgi:hypothetical protein
MKDNIETAARAGIEKRIWKAIADLISTHLDMCNDSLNNLHGWERYELLGEMEKVRKSIAYLSDVAHSTPIYVTQASGLAEGIRAARAYREGKYGIVS